MPLCVTILTYQALLFSSGSLWRAWKCNRSWTCNVINPWISQNMMQTDPDPVLTTVLACECSVRYLTTVSNWSGHPDFVTLFYNHSSLIPSCELLRICNKKPPSYYSLQLSDSVTCFSGIIMQACTVTLPAGISARGLRFTPSLSLMRALTPRARAAFGST